MAERLVTINVMRVAICLVILILVFSGCTVATSPSILDPSTLSSQERARLDDLRQMADRTTMLYGKPPVRVNVIPSRPPFHHAIAKPEQGLILFPSGLLSFRDPQWGRLVMAHELAHYLLGHQVSQSMVVNQERELEANRMSVEILTRVLRMPEEQAVRGGAIFLRASQEQQPGRPPFPGHRPPCEELNDLLARYPQYQARIQDEVSRFAANAGWLHSCP